jgi:hypothetical protein
MAKSTLDNRQLKTDKGNNKLHFDTEVRTLKDQIEAIQVKLLELERIETALLTFTSRRAQTKGTLVESIRSLSQVDRGHWNKAARATQRAMFVAATSAKRGARPKRPIFPQPCREVDDAHTVSERALHDKLLRLGAGTLKHPRISSTQGRQCQYFIEASLTALSQACEMRHSAVARLLRSLVEKRTIRILRRGRCHHDCSLYVIDAFEDVQAARCSREGATPEMRIGVDASGAVWHNGRAKSKRLLSEKELNEWLVSGMARDVVGKDPDLPAQPSCCLTAQSARNRATSLLSGIARILPSAS